MFLADTNIVSELMRPLPDVGVVQWARRVDQAGASFTISAITVDEIIFGLKWRPNASKMVWFISFLKKAQVLGIDTETARRAGELRADMARRGKVRQQPDMLIAATAQIHALTLVTRNVRDFDGCGIGLLNPFAA